MAYSAADLDRRLKLAREILSAYERPEMTRDLVSCRLSGPGRKLDIPFPAGLEPKTTMAQVGAPDAPLPSADVVVLTYTSDEAKALADVLTPDRFSSDWAAYTRNYASFLPEIRDGAPARLAGRLGRYWTTTIGSKKVLVFKSELHLHQDFTKGPNGKPTMPILDLFLQILREAGPTHFFCIGTAGGTYTDKPLGTVVASRAVQFRCEKDFRDEPFASEAFRCDWEIPTTHRANAVALMANFTAYLTIARTSSAATCPCEALQTSRPPAATFLLDGRDDIPRFHPVLTTDYFEFGTDANDLAHAGVAVEMDDAVLGLAVQSAGSAVKWASIRNYSDPAINSHLGMQQQEHCAASIYLKYGYWTSVLGAIATWSILAALP